MTHLFSTEIPELDAKIVEELNGSLTMTNRLAGRTRPITEDSRTAAAVAARQPLGQIPEGELSTTPADLRGVDNALRRELERLTKTFE